MVIIFLSFSLVYLWWCGFKIIQDLAGKKFIEPQGANFHPSKGIFLSNKQSISDTWYGMIIILLEVKSFLPTENINIVDPKIQGNGIFIKILTTRVPLLERIEVLQLI